MITVNLSIDQLAEAVRNLNDNEKEQIRQVLDEDHVLSDVQEHILAERDVKYERGEMQTFTIDEVKARLNYTDK